VSSPIASESPAIHASGSPSNLNMWVWLSFLLALSALVGSLWLSMGLELKACPLCLYQRTFVMAVVAVFGVGLLIGPRHRGALLVLSFPLAVAGFGVAIFHEYLELTDKLECPAGILGAGTAPQQSLAVLTLLVAVLAIGTVRSVKVETFGWAAVLGAILLGLLLTAAAIFSAPPMPAPPTKAYETPLEICRPPFRP
jgi:disulfide bond formation protein DsbB